MHKAFSQFTIKSFDESEGIIKGIATTPATDKVGDIVEPLGAQFTLPIPLHHEHDRKDVVGHVIEAEATAEGIEFTARVAKDVSEQIAEVWRRVKGGLIQYVSVGFRPIAYEPIAGGTRFTQWAWDELSLTTIPANTQAAIMATKAIKTSLSIHMENAMTIAEQIQQFELKKSAALAGMDSLIAKGVTLADEDDAAYQAHEADVAQIEKHLARLKNAETRGAQAAVAVGIQSVQVIDNAPKGTDFVRYTKALALSRGNPMMALEVARGMNYGPRVETVLKAAVAAGTTTGASFTSLIQPEMMTNEFIDLLRPNLIVSKMSQVRNVPMNIKMPRTSTGTTSGWVGEGRPAPITNAAFSDLSIGEHKLGAIAVFTEELLRRSEPAAEALVTNDLVATVATAIDVAFIDQANAGVADVKPASIANAATTAATAGPTPANVRTDVKAAYLNAATTNQPLSSAVWIMHPSTALALSMMTNATTGLREFPGVDFVTGGTFEGLPVIVSTSVPGSAGAGYDVILAVQNEILLAEGGLSIDASREASLEMNDAPTNNSATPTATTLVSLWQSGSVAIKAIRGITWVRRRPTAVYRISACKYA
ncbi:phage major capsid protein [Accumulibacter sp.]|uniref:phage major capsid protein n=1 Tax=Accumulibacter sp. TaxID=2053492 RepID=UPI001AD2E859|nr:phage major capsid protein [Accumulibacter sp.]MBN8515277.1 phage major capsid protein [Accumulibacter sp.]MBO3701580.1 phage major capsid protein [Accumulibacter sp.]